MARKIGLPPGTPVYTGSAPDGPVHVRVFQYGTDHVEERVDVPIDELATYVNSRSNRWIDVDGIHDVAFVQRVCDLFCIHPLTVEDIVHVGLRPKAEEYDDYFFVAIEMLNLLEGTENDPYPRLHAEQISILFGAGFVLTFQERPGDVWDNVRKRLRMEGSAGRLRRMSSDYLSYSLLDAIVDHYFLVLDSIGEDVEDVEDIALDQLNEGTVERIHEMKRQLLMLRKTVWPLREVTGVLGRSNSPVIAETTLPYLRDLHDHVVQAIDTTELYRESAVALLELYLAGTSNRLNQVMTVLTVLTAVFIPVTFVAGIYGMNFDDMPELHWRYGYLWSLGLMATISLGMIGYFRRQGWV